jgi:hypothetical protein
MVYENGLGTYGKDQGAESQQEEVPENRTKGVLCIHGR